VLCAVGEAIIAHRSVQTGRRDEYWPASNILVRVMVLVDDYPYQSVNQSYEGARNGQNQALALSASGRSPLPTLVPLLVLVALAAGRTVGVAALRLLVVADAREVAACGGVDDACQKAAAFALRAGARNETVLGLELGKLCLGLVDVAPKVLYALQLRPVAPELVDQVLLLILNSCCMSSGSFSAVLMVFSTVRKSCT
jgi:hypothetical protein